jgi:hypothetical protein
VTEVDSVRLLASEYNLEFVDLDRFPVDPTVASVLPVKIAKQYRVVPVARKFGAPVIAISNPADVVAIDTLRTSIGREFISVVASSDQIDSTLERVYNDGGSQYAAHSAVAVAEPELDELAVLDDFTDLDDLEALGLGSLADEANAPTDHSDPLAACVHRGRRCEDC